MAKKKANMTNKNSMANQRKKAAKGRVVQNRTADPTPRLTKQVLDRAALQYAKLLDDPCNADLVPGVGFGFGGGIITRFASDNVGFSRTGETAGWLVWIPGASSYIFNSTIATTDTVSSPGSSLTPSPGNALLLTGATAYRCLSACLQISYPGSELTRAGVVSVGYSSGSNLIDLLPVANGGNGFSSTTVGIRNACFHSERTPSSYVEIKWKPSQGDLTFQPVSNRTDNVAGAVADQTAIIAGFSGLPAATGIRTRFVAVYEWIPGDNQDGIVATSGPSVGSRNTINEVMAYLDSLGNWFIKSAWDNKDVLLGAAAYALT
jgi:hypothetical protein